MNYKVSNVIMSHASFLSAHITDQIYRYSVTGSMKTSLMAYKQFLKSINWFQLLRVF